MTTQEAITLSFLQIKNYENFIFKVFPHTTITRFHNDTRLAEVIWEDKSTGEYMVRSKVFETYREALNWSRDLESQI